MVKSSLIYILRRLMDVEVLILTEMVADWLTYKAVVSTEMTILWWVRTRSKLIRVRFLIFIFLL